jgi:cation diffusion facilitator CzcD-associated flavoprotein CzcO
VSDRVAVIGGGISGLTYAHVLRKNGFEPVVFEKAGRVGGVWAIAYPGVRLQNVDFHYHLSDVPWPSKPDFHPTGEQIRAYWSHAVDTLKLDVRLGTEVRSAEERDGKWQVVTATNIATKQHIFDRLVVATGQYTEGKHRPPFDGEPAFGGWIGTERDVGDFSAFAGKRTVVVGFGKSALDVATLASIHGGHVIHVFRTPRWVLPLELFGIHVTWFLFTRFGSVMMTAWGHPTPPERFLHSWLGGGVQLFWKVLTEVIRFQIGRSAAGTGPEGRKRLAAVLPDHPLLPDLRSATALEPTDYFRRVATGDIRTHQAALEGFDAGGVRLADGTRIAADRVVLAIGSESPKFPFLPAAMRAELEGEPDGPQLYRHLVHPAFPHVGFAGFNHGFMHVPSAEIGAQWLACLWRGDLHLPPREEMQASIDRIRAWKRAHIVFEPSRGCAVSTRYQQHIDMLLQDLGVSPYRKLPNVVAEVFGRYGASDYAGVLQEVRASRRPMRPRPLDA